MSPVSPPHPDALAAAAVIADRLAEPHHECRSARAGRSRPQSLAGGAAGIALLHIERARTGHGTWATARAWLSAAAADELSAGPNASLFFGVPALAFVIHTAADQPGHYQRALTALDTSTRTLTRRRLADAHDRIDRGARPTLAEFDLLRGLAGLSAYHLHRHPDHDITAAVLSYLVRLTDPLPGNGGLPGWWTGVSPNGAPSPDFPGGHGNLGMSHGIAAVLAALAVGMRRGVVVDGHRDAIGRICAWLDTWQQHHNGPWWPGFLTLHQAHHGHVDQSSRGRPSWCYGTPGLARAQQLAALALGDTTRQHLGETAMLGDLRDQAQLDRITDSGLCHGMAGLLQTTWRMAADARSTQLAAEVPALCARLLTQLHCAPPDSELPDKLPGEFLDGHAGVALALHTAGTGTAPLSNWDACLLLT